MARVQLAAAGRDLALTWEIVQVIQSTRVRGVATFAVAAAIVAGCYGGPVGEATVGSTESAPATEVAPATSTPEPSLAPTPTPTEAPTPEPTPEPTPKPTPKPTPIPWKSDGPAGSIDVPYAIYAGTTITFRLWSMPAPASCTLNFTWPDATKVALGKKTAAYVGPSAGSSNGYAASWKLKIPATQIGDGTFTYVCTYLGVKRIDSWFSINIRPPK